MKAIIKAEQKPGSLALVEKDIPVPKEGQVLVKMLTAGICGTDLAIYNWSEHMAKLVCPPVIIGHEGCGVIESVGPGINHVNIGEVVGIENHIPCGKCINCLNGKGHICLNLKYLGLHMDGLFAEYAVVPANLVFKLNEKLSPEMGALFDPYGLAVRAVTTGGGIVGKTVLVTGSGPIGLLTCAFAKHLGAKAVIVSEISPYRLKFLKRHSKELGIDRIVDSSKEDVVQVVKSMTDHAGADVWIDFVGSDIVLEQGIKSTRPGGDARLFAPKDKATINLSELILHEIQIQTIHGRHIFDTWHTSSGIINSMHNTLKCIITHKLPLEEYDQAFELVQNGEAMKVIFEIGEK